jgi:4-carboxymuconolactone decarboxylase
MARVPYVDREEMDAAGKVIYDRIRSDRNATTVGLQFRTLLNSPEAASYLTSMGAVLRFKSAMPENLKEFAITVVAREWNSDIEWTAHAALAAKAGVSAGSLEAVRTGKGLSALTADEQIITRFVHQLLRDKNVTDDVFAAAQKLLDTRGVVDLTLSCGYYSAINMAQLALKPEMDAGKTSTL